jgi:hypothetical protein
MVPDAVRDETILGWSRWCSGKVCCLFLWTLCGDYIWFGCRRADVPNGKAVAMARRLSLVTDLPRSPSLAYQMHIAFVQRFQGSSVKHIHFGAPSAILSTRDKSIAIVQAVNKSSTYQMHIAFVQRFQGSSVKHIRFGAQSAILSTRDESSSLPIYLLQHDINFLNCSLALVSVPVGNIGSCQIICLLEYL